MKRTRRRGGGRKWWPWRCCCCCLRCVGDNSAFVGSPLDKVLALRADVEKPRPKTQGIGFVFSSPFWFFFG